MGDLGVDVIIGGMPHEWAYGFGDRYDDHYGWKRWPTIVYYPLLNLDHRLWHTREKARSGEYPIDKMKEEDVWQVLRPTRRSPTCPNPPPATRHPSRQRHVLELVLQRRPEDHPRRLVDEGVVLDRAVERERVANADLGSVPLGRFGARAGE